MGDAVWEELIKAAPIAVAIILVVIYFIRHLEKRDDHVSKTAERIVGGFQKTVESEGDKWRETSERQAEQNKEIQTRSLDCQEATTKTTAELIALMRNNRKRNGDA